MKPLARFIVAAFIVAVMPVGAGAQDCPGYVVSIPKSSSLYLYFPTASDATFPSYGGVNTSPLPAFNMSNHDAALSTAQVRQRVLELVRAGYCEFDVDVRLTTTAPAPAEARWQIVGIGSDTSTGGQLGKAQAVDTGDADAQDYCRVWTEGMEAWLAGEVTGTNSTVERWATAIANLSSHESGHNYGSTHGDSSPRSGEDAAPNHFMADPAAGATQDTITDRLNHFSDATYERFGHDLGLVIKTLHNWDFVNPNSGNADQLTITLLSDAASLTIGWFYNGTLSPWTNPTVTKQPGTINFRGTAYNVFNLVFSSPKAWSGGANGIAPPGEKFHVGASFTQPNPVIVYETTLFSGGSELSLKPRIFGYDAGTAGDGGFDVNFFNTGATDLVISDIEVFFLPRMVDIEQMVVGGALRSIQGLPVVPFQRQPANEENDGIIHRLRQPVRVGKEPFTLRVAKLTDRRHLDYVIREGECESSTSFGIPREVYCPTPGHVLSLFPATYVYVIATVTEPNARFWDKTQGRLVDGPLTTRVFFQVAGEVPDANRNGVDDLTDIREGTSRDTNGNGIPDEGEGGGGARGLAVFARIGVAFPHGSASRILDPGPSLAAGLEYELSSTLSAIGTLGFDRLSDDGLGTDADIAHLTIGGKLYFFSSGGSWRPFAELSLGLYDVDPGDTEAGGNAGVGLRWDRGGRLSIEAAYLRHRVQTGGGDDLDYSTAQLGLRWKL